MSRLRYNQFKQYQTELQLLRWRLEQGYASPQEYATKRHEIEIKYKGGDRHANH